MTPPTDAELVARDKGGDPDAFGAIMLQYGRSITALLFRRCGNQDLALDLSQETFLRAWRGLKTYRESLAPLPVWLRSIATHVSAEWHRRRSTSEVTQDPADETNAIHALCGARGGVVDAVAQDELDELTAQTCDLLNSHCLPSLPAEVQTFLRMKYWDGLTLEEICSRLNLAGNRAGLARSARERLSNHIKLCHPELFARLNLEGTA